MDQTLSLNTCMTRPNELIIGIGYEGPTDCCLTLSSTEKTKQFGIESASWRICSSVLDNEGNGMGPVRIPSTNRWYKDLLYLLESDTSKDET